MSSTNRRDREMYESFHKGKSPSDIAREKVDERGGGTGGGSKVSNGEVNAAIERERKRRGL